MWKRFSTKDTILIFLPCQCWMFLIMWSWSPRQRTLPYSWSYWWWHPVAKSAQMNRSMLMPILKHELPWIKWTLWCKLCVAARCSTLSYGKKKTQEYLKENMLNFWGKDLWPPELPDFNFLECSILAYMEQMACKKPHPSVDASRATITRTWKKINTVYVKKTCQSFRHGLESTTTKD